MKSIKNRKTLKIAGATSVTLFSLVSVFAATIAWFALNNNVSGNGMRVNVASGSDISILHCYAVRYDGDTGAVAIDISNGVQQITMSEYDTIFTDRNVNTPLFLRMELTDFDRNDDIIVTIPCTGAYKTGNCINPYLSNVVSAKFLYGLKNGNTVSADNYTWSGSEVSNASVLASYQGMLARSKDFSGTPFVSSGTKQNSVSLTIDGDDIFNNTYIIHRENKDVVVIYIALDYHVSGGDNLITEYLDSYNGDAHELSFSSDISTITIDNGGN